MRHAQVSWHCRFIQAKPWFCTVIVTVLLSMSLTGATTVVANLS
ncbi:hypothetical protein ACNKHS_00250 [Shigella flexneri]